MGDLVQRTLKFFGPDAKDVQAHVIAFTEVAVTPGSDAQGLGHKEGVPETAPHCC